MNLLGINADTFSKTIGLTLIFTSTKNTLWPYRLLINSIFLVINLMLLLRIFFVLKKGDVSRFFLAFLQVIGYITLHIGNMNFAPMELNNNRQYG